MPAAELLNRKAATGVSVATGVNTDVLLECGGNSTLVVEADMSADAAPDLAVVVQPVGEDGEVYPLAQPAVQSIGPTLTGGRTYFWAQYDITAQQRVRVRLTNNNAGTKSLDYSLRMA